MNVIDVSVFIDIILMKLIGVSGTVSITAPFPERDVPDMPYRLVAVSLARILEPHDNTKGRALRVAIGIEHFDAIINCELAPSQLLKS